MGQISELCVHERLWCVVFDVWSAGRPIYSEHIQSCKGSLVWLWEDVHVTYCWVWAAFPIEKQVSKLAAKSRSKLKQFNADWHWPHVGQITRHYIHEIGLANELYKRYNRCDGFVVTSAYHLGETMSSHFFFLVPAPSRLLYHFFHPHVLASLWETLPNYSFYHHGIHCSNKMRVATLNKLPTTLFTFTNTTLIRSILIISIYIYEIVFDSFNLTLPRHTWKCCRTWQ